MTIENRLSDRDDFENHHEDVTNELIELRTWTDQIEANAVGAFNEHMENLCETLGYDNFDRI